MFIEKNLKTIIYIIKKIFFFFNIKIKQNLLFNIKEQKNKNHKILNFIEKKKQKQKQQFKKKSKFFFKNISKFCTTYF